MQSLTDFWMVPSLKKQFSEGTCDGFTCLQSPGEVGRADEVCKAVLSVNVSTLI